MRKVIATIFAVLILINTVVFAKENINIFITDITAEKGLVTVYVANTLKTETVVTMTAIKLDNDCNEDDRTYAVYQKNVAPLSTIEFQFIVPDNKNGISPYGIYEINVQNLNGERASRDWVYMQYPYSLSVDEKFDYLVNHRIIDETDDGMYIVRHMFKLIMGPEPHDGRLFRELSRRTFLNYVCNMIGDYGFTGSYSPEAIAIAEEKELIEAGKTDHYKPLIYEDAVTILVKALGYKKDNEQTEYLTIAEEIGLLKDVAATEGDRIKTFDAVTLLYNAAEIQEKQEAFIIGPDFYDRYDERENELNALAPEHSGKTVWVRAEVANYGKDDFAKSAVLITAIYKDSALVDVKTSQPVDIIKGADAKELLCDIELPHFTASDRYLLRAYLWENIGSATPLCSFAEIGTVK